MTQMTPAQELDAHCRALLTLLDEARVPYVRHDPDNAHDTWVLLRPTLEVWRLSQCDQRSVEQELRAEPERAQLCVVQAPGTDTWIAMVPLHALTARYIMWARHPACLPYCEWLAEVLHATSKHGWYDPATNHTPPPGQELDALERREHHRDLLNALGPGIGDALSGHRPSTEEGRRMLWHRVVDPETGEATMVNDADIPEEDEDDAADH